MPQPNQTVPPTSIVIFGASGDLTRRKLVPALYNLYRRERLPERVRIVGVSRSSYSNDDFRERMRGGVQQFSGNTFDPALWEAFAPHLFYARGDLDNLEDFHSLDTLLREFEAEMPTDNSTPNRLYYLSISPELYVTAIENLAAAGMSQETEGARRVIIEKPFGRDLASAQALNRKIHDAFQEHQVYRIDHYLGKETAQNVLFFRFGNMVFENVWNRNYIDHVQITVAETVDVGHRAAYYDKSGVLRDMFQNHLLQLLALVAMEPSSSFNADAVRNETAKVFSSIRPITPEVMQRHTVRAQYRGYREEPGVAADTDTPTYAALRLFIDNWRWQGVPFYLRSGKTMPHKVSEVVIQFHCPPHMMFPLSPGQTITPDVLSLCIQPDEGIHFRFQAKVPGTISDMRSVDMSFHYADICEFRTIPEAYERLLLDALIGDATLFIRSDAIEMAWRFIDPIIEGWQTPTAPPMVSYERGTWGPEEADALLAQDGRAWMWGCAHGDEDEGDDHHL